MTSRQYWVIVGLENDARERAICVRHLNQSDSLCCRIISDLADEIAKIIYTYGVRSEPDLPISRASAFVFVPRPHVIQFSRDLKGLTKIFDSIQLCKEKLMDIEI